ncbi:hypothetical protein BB561_004587 [Smittium simulii]|uniref:Uncharacterized protein n=1 Tax=Smittium simulii TaxID=133385 RepID=A0A2T9YFA4_9FUNG|nr:hypothetical protein BB561_004587 [Smittium simulii]
MRLYFYILAIFLLNIVLAQDPPDSEAIEPGSEAIEPGSEAIKPGSEAIKPGSEAIEPGSEAVNDSPASADLKSNEGSEPAGNDIQLHNAASDKPLESEPTESQDKKLEGEENGKENPDDAPKEGEPVAKNLSGQEPSENVEGAEGAENVQDSDVKPIASAPDLQLPPNEYVINFDPQNITDILKRDKFIPDVIPEFLPTTYLEVVYANRSMHFGTEYFTEKNETLELPLFNYTTKPDTLYTIALIDPDALSKKESPSAQSLNWFCTDIPGTNVSQGNSALNPYIPPEEYPGCGEKRFIYFLAEQAGNTTVAEVPKKRCNFKFAKVVEQNKMKIIAANYFIVKYLPGSTCKVPDAVKPTDETTPTKPKDVEDVKTVRTRRTVTVTETRTVTDCENMKYKQTPDTYTNLNPKKDGETPDIMNSEKVEGEATDPSAEPAGDVNAEKAGTEATEPSAEPAGDVNAEKAGTEATEPSAEPAGDVNAEKAGTEATEPSAEPAGDVNAEKAGTEATEPSAEPAGDVNAEKAGTEATEPSAEPAGDVNAEKAGTEATEPSAEPAEDVNAEKAGTEATEPSAEPAGDVSAEKAEGDYS